MTVSATLTFPTPGPTSLTLASLTRTDTDAAVTGSIAQRSALVWVLSITEPVPGLVYAYILTGTWADGSAGTVNSTVNGTGASVGTGTEIQITETEVSLG
jgi:hypothetical protein